MLYTYSLLDEFLLPFVLNLLNEYRALFCSSFLYFCRIAAILSPKAISKDYQISHKSYRTFSQEKFREELPQKLTECQIDTYEDRQQISLEILNKFAPLKEITIRGNHKPHFSKDLQKAKMKRTKIKRIANIIHFDENIRKYKNQRNLVAKINKQAKF